jgi:GTP-binding protein EngB required for normal cell division
VSRIGQRLRPRHRRADLPVMLTALDDALDALQERADPALLARASSLATRAGERLRLSGEHTVVALAGSTGSGKSSLFNALAGSDLSPVGVRRPTTSKAHACVWGAEGAAPLVQWLGVPRRQTAWQHGAVAEDNPGLDGLVLLDLPDHDSAVVDHRLQVDRLVELVDLLIWVVDPQKYADGALHERYLRPLAGHAAVTVVLLNQVDTLNPFAAAECADDLRRLVDADGLRRANVLTTSARTGAGLDELRGLLAEAVTRRQARNDRLVADVEQVAYVLAPAVSLQASPDVSAGRTQLVDALASSAGVLVIGAAVEQSWRLRADGALGWPPTRWVRRLRPDPLRRLHLRSGERREVRSMVRSSVPQPSRVQTAQVESAVRRVCDGVAADLPARWQQSVRRAAGAQSEDVRDALDKAVVGTDLGVDRTPLWWKGAAALQWLLVAAALVGAGWLLLLAFGSYLQLPDPPTPDLWGLAVPTLLLVGGVALGLLLAFLGRWLARGGAVVRRRRAESRLRSGIEAVADGLVIRPVEAELERHARARDALARATGS